MKEILDRVVVRVLVNGNFSGSGVLFRAQDGNQVILATASHCIFGIHHKYKTKTGHVSVEIYDDAGGNYSRYGLSKQDTVFYSKIDAGDTALFIIKDRKINKLKLPVVRLARYNSGSTGVFFKGFPKVEDHQIGETVGANIIMDDSNGNIIKSRYDTDFNGSSSSDENLKGFSGSGLFEEVNGKLYLLGILTDIRTAGRLVSCSTLKGLLKLSGIELPYPDIDLIRTVPDELFEVANARAIRALGPRYSPGFTFRTPLFDVFDSLAGGQKFSGELHQQKRRFQDLFDQYLSAKASLSADLYGSVIDFKLKVDPIRYPFENLGALINAFEHNVVQLFDAVTRVRKIMDPELLDELFNQVYNLGYIVSNTVSYGPDFLDARKDNVFLGFAKAATAVWGNSESYWNFFKQQSIGLFQERILFVEGMAGTGKSHMLADIVEQRNEIGHKSLFILGQDLTGTNDPWNQIIAILDLKCTPDEFLDCLNRKAKNAKQRILIFLDAVNEGAGLVLWRKHLEGFLDKFNQHKHLALVLTYRSTYQQAIFSKPHDYHVVTTEGFKGYENEAMRSFFRHYEIELPVHPVLSSEFGNPLFLTLLCKGIKHNPGKFNLKGIQGIGRVFESYLNYTNEKLGEQTGYKWYKINLVRKVVAATIEKMADQQSLEIGYDLAYSLVQKTIEGYLQKTGFLDDLISENIFIEAYGRNNEFTDLNINFAYQRVGDHLLSGHLLRKIGTDISAAFKKEGVLYSYFKNEDSRLSNKGLLEALAIKIPDTYGLELYKAAPHLKYDRHAFAAFLDGLTWRSWTIEPKELLAYFKAIFKKHQTLLPMIWEAGIGQTAQLYTSLNGYVLHVFLKSLTISQRDATWTNYVNNVYEGNGTIDRLIGWAWKDELHSETSENAFLLTGSTLIWFLASSNRPLRDNSTKALINLFHSRIPLLMRLMGAFKDVNDPYVAQRVYAVAYGCAVRTENLDHLSLLADYVFKSFFDVDEVLPDILARDYAREIIEYAQFKGLCGELEPSVFRPPYKSTYPGRLPTNRATDKRRVEFGDPLYHQGHYGLTSIMDSMVTEYGRGIARYGDFGRYTFESALSFWLGSGVDANRLSNLAIKWIIDDFGYDPKVHGLLDAAGNRGNGIERLGKKYQWIAMHKILALVADNKTFYSDRRSARHKAKYEGPWQPMVRDIDPTFLNKYNRERQSTIAWAEPERYDSWTKDLKKWIEETKDLPSSEDIVLVDDHDGVSWVSLETSPRWQEPGDEKDYQKIRPEIWYQIRSYVVEKKDYKRILDWAARQNFDGRWMPESGSRYQMFDSEYYWSPAATTFDRPEFGDGEWSEINEKGFYCRVGITTQHHNWDEQHDSSFEGNRSFYKPSKKIFELLNLTSGTVEGQLFDQNGQLICFDPSVANRNSGNLLVKLDVLKKMLKENGLKIFWTVLGEKRVLGRYDKDEYPGTLHISQVVYLSGKGLKVKSKFRKK